MSAPTAEDGCEDSVQLGDPSDSDADSLSDTSVGLLCLPDELILMVLELLIGVAAPLPANPPSLVTIQKEQVSQLAVNKRVYQLAKRAGVPRAFSLGLFPTGHPRPFDVDDSWTFERAQAWLEDAKSYLSRVREVQLVVENPLNLDMRIQSVPRFTRDMVHLVRLSLDNWPATSRPLDEQALSGLPSSLRTLRLGYMQLHINVLRSILLQLPCLLFLHCDNVLTFNSGNEHVLRHGNAPPRALSSDGDGIDDRGGGVVPVNPVFRSLTLSTCNFATNRLINFDLACPLQYLQLNLSTIVWGLTPDLGRLIPASLETLVLDLNIPNVDLNKFRLCFDGMLFKLRPSNMPHLKQFVVADDGANAATAVTTNQMVAFFDLFRRTRAILFRLTPCRLSISILRGFLDAFRNRIHSELQDCYFCLVDLVQREPPAPNTAALEACMRSLRPVLMEHNFFQHDCQRDCLASQTDNKSSRRDGQDKRTIREHWRSAEGEETAPSPAS